MGESRLIGLCLALAVVVPTPDYAYLSPVGEVWQVWASRSGEPAHPITTDAEDKLYLSAAAGSGELLAVTRGGAGLLLAASGAVTGRLDLGTGVHEASLAPDGSRVAFAREEGPAQGRRRELWLMDRSGSRRRLAGPGAAVTHTPAFSVDGASVAFTAPGDGGGEDVWLMQLEGSALQQLTVGGFHQLEPSVAPGGDIYVSSNRGGDYDIWRIDHVDQTLHHVVGGPGFDGQPRVSPDGGRLLYVSRRDGRGEVWVSRADGSDARPLTDGAVEARCPVWLRNDPATAATGPASPSEAVTGSNLTGRIAFLMVKDGRWRPFSVRADGSDLRQLAEFPVDVARATLSEDGSLLLADGIDGSLTLVKTADGSARTVVVDPAEPTDAAISRDGRWIAYSVNTLGGVDSNDLWLVGVAGGRAKKITDQPYLQHFPTWGPAGEILYLSGRGGQTHDIWQVTPGKEAPRPIVGDHLYNFEPVMSSHGDVAFSSNQDGNYEIWMLAQGAKEARRLTDDLAYDGQPSFSPDGSHLAFLSRRGGASRIWILDLATGDHEPLPIEGQIRLPYWYSGAAGGGARAAGEASR